MCPCEKIVRSKLGLGLLITGLIVLLGSLATGVFAADEALVPQPVKTSQSTASADCPTFCEPACPDRAADATIVRQPVRLMVEVPAPVRECPPVPCVRRCYSWENSWKGGFKTDPLMSH